MRFRDLPDWPGGPGGAYDRMYKSPTNDEAILTEVPPSRGNGVVFKCEFEGMPHTYDIEVSDARLAVSIENKLRRNIGKSVTELGDLEVPSSEHSRTA